MWEGATPTKVHLVGKELSKGSSFLFTAWTALCGDGISGKSMITNRGLIHYSKKKGVHIVPCKPKEGEWR